MFNNEKGITIQFVDGLYKIGISEEFLKLSVEDRVYIVTRLASALGVKEILKIFW